MAASRSFNFTPEGLRSSVTGPSNNNPAIKREVATPSIVPPGLASSIAQSLNQYDQAIMERRHKSVLSTVADRCPIFKDVPNTYTPPTLQELPLDSLGVALYLPRSSYRSELEITVPSHIANRLRDPALERFLPFANEDMRRVMVLGIYKFFLWQCQAIDDLRLVSQKNHPLEWLDFPQMIYSRGYRLANLPARALYPNGQSHSNPLNYPSEVLNDIIQQFAHPDPASRFGLVSIAHDEQSSPFMAKVFIDPQSHDRRPVEWSMAPLSTHLGQPNATEPERCRCNLCIDSLLGGSEARLGLRLVVPMDFTSANNAANPIRAASEWSERLNNNQEVFNLSEALLARLEPSSQPRPQASRASRSQNADSYQDDTDMTTMSDMEGNQCSKPGILLGDVFTPAFVHADLEETDCDGDEDFTPQDHLSTFSEDTGDSETPPSPFSSQPDPTEVALDDIPSICDAEVEWDLEDLEIDRRRTAEDVVIKRKREEEDRIKDCGRKKRRVTLEVEYQMDLMAREREEEDRRREEERKREDERVKARLMERLAAIS